jgi:hypothetical protein
MDDKIGLHEFCEREVKKILLPGVMGSVCKPVPTNDLDPMQDDEPKKPRAFSDR